MGNIQFHSESSARLFGGVASDYFPIHEFLDSSKLFLADWRHRGLFHTTAGVYLAEKWIFGHLYKRPSDGVEVCTRTVVETHIKEDLRFIPTPAEFLREMPIRRWMNGVTPRQLREMQTVSVSTSAECICNSHFRETDQYCGSCGLKREIGEVIK